MDFIRSCLLLLIFCPLVVSCVSSGKYKRTVAEYERALSVTQDSLHLRTAALDSTALLLGQERTGNSYLLEAQSGLLDRISERERELADTRGNLSTTSSQLTRQLERLRTERAAAEAERDSLFATQQRMITDFQAGVERVSSILLDSLDGKLEPTSFFVTDRPGEVVLSIQEDVLFRRASVSNFAVGAEDIFRLVTDRLQDDPLLKLRVEGHTDNTPNPRRGTDNWTYGALRAAAIVDELATNYYLSPNRLTPASGGESSPARSNSTPEGQRANRRIDFVFYNNVGNLTRALGRLVPKK